MDHGGGWVLVSIWLGCIIVSTIGPTAFDAGCASDYMLTYLAYQRLVEIDGSPSSPPGLRVLYTFGEGQMYVLSRAVVSSHKPNAIGKVDSHCALADPGLMCAISAFAGVASLTLMHISV